MAAMRVIKDIDIMGDVRLQRLLSWLGLGILAGGFAVGLIAWGAGATEAPSLAGIVAYLALSVVALPVHELVHAGAFRLLGGRDVRIRFGYREGMLFTGAGGAVLPRGWFACVLLAPTVVLSCGFVALGATLGLPLLAWTCLSTHLAGCVGDLAMAWEVARTRGCTHVRDTSSGIQLLG
jgi:hypothetical protein